MANNLSLTEIVTANTNIVFIEKCKNVASAKRMALWAKYFILTKRGMFCYLNGDDYAKAAGLAKPYRALGEA